MSPSYRTLILAALTFALISCDKISELHNFHKSQTNTEQLKNSFDVYFTTTITGHAKKVYLHGFAEKSEEYLTTRIQDNQKNLINEVTYYRDSSGGSLSLLPVDPLFLGPGIFKDNAVTVQLCKDEFCDPDTARIIKLSVTLEINDTPINLQVAPDVLVFNGTAGFTPASQTLSLNSSMILSYSIQYANENDWLEVSFNYTNASSSSINVKVVPILPPGTYKANILLAAKNSVYDFSIPVEYTVTPRQTKYITPHFAYSDSEEEVIINGTGFSTNPVQNVMFGEFSAKSFSVVSDTEIRAIHPFLSSGTYPVIVQDSLEKLQTQAELTVITPPVFSSNSTPVSMDGHFNKLLYEPVQQSFYILTDDNHGSVSGNVLRRYTYNGNNWDSTTIAINESVVDFTITKDGKQLLVLTIKGLLHLDIGLLSINEHSTFSFTGHQIAATNDGMAVILADDNDITASIVTPQDRFLYPYDIQQHTILNPITFTASKLSFGETSGDGRVYIFMTTDDTVGDVFKYYTSTGKVANVHSTYYSTNTLVNRDGNRYMVENKNPSQALEYFWIFDNDDQLIGISPAGRECSTLGSADNKAYSYGSSTTSNAKTMSVYDLQTSITNITMDPIAEIPSTDQNTCLALISSPDGKYLFLLTTTDSDPINNLQGGNLSIVQIP